MRDAFCNGMVKLVNNDHVFLTGDLGFQALEPLAAVMGDRFINAGIAEQNMIGMAAGLARSGMMPWCYSIAPFVYARPFEQIRNDIGLHNLPVRLVGNGGGYGYGVMGATHHAIEDYGVMCAIQNMRCYIPAFDADMDDMLPLIADTPNPSYLRLGRQEHNPVSLPDYVPWRKLVCGQAYKQKPIIIAVGPIAGALMQNLTKGDDDMFDPDPTKVTHRSPLWVVSELPFIEVPLALRCQMCHNPNLIVVEEHIAQGSFGQQLAYHLSQDGVNFTLTHFCAKGYLSGRYGSQNYHRIESDLNIDKICRDHFEAFGYYGYKGR